MGYSNNIAIKKKSKDIINKNNNEDNNEYININKEIKLKFISSKNYITGVLIERDHAVDFLKSSKQFNFTNVEVYNTNNNIYPINVTNLFLMNNISWTNNKLYMLYKNDFMYNNKLVIPIENLLYNRSYNKFDDLYSKKFNYLYSKKLCWFANIYNILVLFDNDILEIICQDYDDLIFYINNSDNLLLNNNKITNYFNYDNINDNINDFSTTNLIFDFNNTICDKKNNKLYYFENNIFLQSDIVKFK
jgi:hypothetical protein